MDEFILKLLLLIIPNADSIFDINIYLIQCNSSFLKLKIYNQSMHLEKKSEFFQSLE